MSVVGGGSSTAGGCVFVSVSVPAGGASQISDRPMDRSRGDPPPIQSNPTSHKTHNHPFPPPRHRMSWHLWSLEHGGGRDKGRPPMEDLREVAGLIGLNLPTSHASWLEVRCFALHCGVCMRCVVPLRVVRGPNRPARASTSPHGCVSATARPTYNIINSHRENSKQRDLSTHISTPPSSCKPNPTPTVPRRRGAVGGGGRAGAVLP
jgi:hypothetical protein